MSGSCSLPGSWNHWGSNTWPQKTKCQAVSHRFGLLLLLGLTRDFSLRQKQTHCWQKGWRPFWWRGCQEQQLRKCYVWAQALFTCWDWSRAWHPHVAMASWTCSPWFRRRPHSSCTWIMINQWHTLHCTALLPAPLMVHEWSSKFPLSLSSWLLKMDMVDQKLLLMLLSFVLLLSKLCFSLSFLWFCHQSSMFGHIFWSIAKYIQISQWIWHGW